jgi:hypothetical protein
MSSRVSEAAGDQENGEARQRQGVGIGRIAGSARLGQRREVIVDADIGKVGHPVGEIVPADGHDAGCAGEHGGETGHAPACDEGGFATPGTDAQSDADSQNNNQSRSKKCFQPRQVRHERRRHSGTLLDRE